MPLILFAGYPSSGKSTWVQKIASLLNEQIATAAKGEPGHGMKVVVHSDESLGIDHDMYIESVTEKAARGAQMSAVRRDISKNTILLLDGMNYIKGFRYQLYCEAKNTGSTYCVAQVVTPTETCFEWNSHRTEGQWDAGLMKALIMRYEEPDGRNRWDSPLINIGYDDAKAPIDEIWQAIVLDTPLKPNHSVEVKPASATNYLQELDRQTSAVVIQIQRDQELNSGGSLAIRVGSKPATVELPPTAVSIAQLQRLRRTFVALNRMHALAEESIVPLFAEYLSHALNE